MKISSSKKGQTCDSSSNTSSNKLHQAVAAIFNLEVQCLYREKRCYYADWLLDRGHLVIM